MYTSRPAVFPDDLPAMTELICRATVPNGLTITTNVGDLRSRARRKVCRGFHLCHDGDGRLTAVLQFDAAACHCDISLDPDLRGPALVAAVIDLAERLALEHTATGSLTIGCMEDDELLKRWLLIRGYARVSSSDHLHRYHIDLSMAPPGA